MGNTQRLGSIWRGLAWDDGEPIPRLALPSGAFAESMVALGYAWDATAGAFAKLSVDHASGSLNVNIVGSDLASASRTFANIGSGSTDASVVAAQASKSIRVLAFVAVCGATATNLTFNSKPGGAGTAVSMTFQNAANGGEALNFNPLGWFQTNSGEGLSATTGAGSTTGVQVVYTLI